MSGDAGLVTDKGDELVDSATSPLKLGGGDEGSDRGQTKVQRHLLLLGSVEEAKAVVGIPPPPPEYIPPKELKRQKKSGKGGSDQVTQASKEAGSALEHRRDQ
jgi:hypothetical protein